MAKAVKLRKLRTVGSSCGCCGIDYDPANGSVKCFTRVYEWARALD